MPQVKIHFYLRRQGFTLPEILITLAIIGVVGALTIPSLITNVQTQQYRSAWKKNYNIISEAVAKMSEDHQGVSMWNAVGDNDWDTNNMRDVFGEYLRYVRTDQAGDLFEPYGCRSNGSSNCWNGITNPYASAAAMLTDGTFLQFNVGTWMDPTAADAATCNGTHSDITNICGFITVDVNGKKSPNLVGTDVFALWIIKTPGGTAYAKPFGAEGDDTGCLTSNDFIGNAGCSYYALMDLDYP